MDYKKEVNDFYNDLDRVSLIKVLHEELNPSTKEVLPPVNFPIYYLFNHAINNQIRANVKNMENLRKNLKLDDLFSLNSENITNIKISNIYNNSNDRISILYKFIANGRHYIYYSKLDINNQIYNEDSKTTSCNIFYFNNEIELWENLSKNIESIINIFNTIDLEKIHLTYSAIDKITPKLLSRDETQKIIESIRRNEIEKYNLNLCDVLLNLVCNKNKPNDKVPDKYVVQCSINHVLFGKDETSYKNEIIKIVESDQVKVLIENCYNGYNKQIYDKIIGLPRVNRNKQPFKEFMHFIRDINEELIKLNISTINYKLKNSFKLEYNSISGLYNGQQKSLSSIFYSYYNLALNIKILNIFNTTKSVKEIIDTFVIFHYKMIYLFCMSNDIKYIPNTFNMYNKDDFYNIQYIYRLIKDNNLLDEMVEFYPDPEKTFLLNQNKLLIDKLLDYKIEGTLIKREINKEIPNNKDIFREWFDYLGIIIFKIRDKSFDKNIENMSKEIKEIFERIVTIITTMPNLYSQLTYINLYFYTISEIWIIYLTYLYEIYEETFDIQTIRTRDTSKSSDNTFINLLSVLNPDVKTDPKECNFIPSEARNYKLGRTFSDFFSKDILLLYLNFNEIVNISNKISMTDLVVDVKYKIKFLYCNYIRITSYSESFLQLSHSTHDITNLKIYSTISIFFNKRLWSNSIKPLLDLYIQTKHKISNKKINDTIISEYRIYNKQIVNIIKNIIKNNIKNYEKIETLINDIGKIDISLIILILTDDKLLITEHLLTNEYILYYSSIINSDTKIFNQLYQPQLKEILTYLCNTSDSIEDKIEKTLRIIKNPINKVDWIKNIDITIPDDINNPFKYDGNEYISLTYNYDDKINNNAIENILYRFGFNFRDIEEYLFLYPNTDTSYTKKKIGKVDIYEIKPNNEKCFILINKYKKCIEITFKDGFINQTECYIFDETNKDKKNKLLFNLKIETHPFISLIPESSPYLCYKKDGDFYLDFILSPTISNNLNNFKSRVYKKTIFTFEFLMYSIKIGPSQMFTTINTYNDLHNNLLFNFYYVSKLKIDTKIDSLKKIYNIEYDFKELNTIIDDLYKKICTTILCDSEIKIEQFKSVLDLLPDTNKETNKETVFNNFYSEHRIANFNCNQKCIDDLKIHIPKLEEIKSEIIRTIKTDKKIDDFIINNVDKWILIMEINILINLINQIKEDSISSDIQDKLTSLNSIRYFNDKIKSNFFYGFEILFLLQNEYFFKKGQMEKYDEIRKDLNLDSPLAPPNTELKLHQFMMGKGKTSIITPLLSFAIRLLKEKQPTIITMDHLIQPTRKYTIFIENITGIKVNIFSDFQAKKRWLEHTDQQLIKDIKKEAKDIRFILKRGKVSNIEKIRELKKRLYEIIYTNLNNEMNLIDEIDSHHNYLQSMFNSINKKNSISEHLFEYIYYFTLNKIKGNPIEKYTPLDEFIQNADLLKSNLEFFYEQSETMVYNKQYGFAHVINKDYNHIPRICTPFTRKDTPVKNSKFSNILLTMILTFKEYIKKYDSYLNNDILYDYYNILNNKTILSDIILLLSIEIERKNEIYAILLENFIDLEIIKDIFKNYIYKDISENIKNKILVKYLYNVNTHEINITTDQYNMSFQDIIYNNYNQWQVGYTGTASLRLNNYDTIDKVPYVFRNIKPDYDEIIEVKLALDGYGKEKYDNKVIIIDKKTSIEDNIRTIYELLKDDPRGFVDLSGVFLEYENKRIANLLYQLFPLSKNKNIVYFEDNNEAYEFTESSEKIKYKEYNKDNFYYYDQCHTVGSDLKQPFNGHIAIIMNRYTRYTDFAQAIFRFRKLNRGTYLSVIFVKDDLKQPDTNEDIYKILKDNEDKFNKNQENGLKYQLLKAMIRKDSKQYNETDLNPEFMRIMPFDKTSSIEYMNNNLHKNQDTLKSFISGNQFIKQIYDDINKFPDSELIRLIVGSGNEIQKHADMTHTIEVEQKSEEFSEVNKIINYDNLYRKVNKFKINKICYIDHLNCSYCSVINCVKLFESSNIKINNKDIYISFNILNDVTSIYEMPEEINYEEIAYKPDNHRYIYTRFHYIEFNDKILIEGEKAALDYYIYKLPVYNHEGRLLVPNMYNKSYEGTKLKILDIDIRFIKMLGIKNYISPKYFEPEEIDIQSAVDDLTLYGLIILSFHLVHNSYRNRYNLSTELQNRMNEFQILEEPTSSDFSIDFSKAEHNVIPKNNLLNVYFNIYQIKLKLNEDGYEMEPEKIQYNYVYNHQVNDIDERIKNLKKNVKYKLKFDKKPNYFLITKITELLKTTQDLNLDYTKESLIKKYNLLKKIINNLLQKKI